MIDHDISKQGANGLCAAATSVFVAVACMESRRLGRPLVFHKLMCPERPPTCPCRLDPKLVDEAEAVLYRLGVICYDERLNLRFVGL